MKYDPFQNRDEIRALLRSGADGEKDGGKTKYKKVSNEKDFNGTTSASVVVVGIISLLVFAYMLFGNRLSVLLSPPEPASIQEAFGSDGRQLQPSVNSGDPFQHQREAAKKRGRSSERGNPNDTNRPSVLIEDPDKTIASSSDKDMDPRRAAAMARASGAQSEDNSVSNNMIQGILSEEPENPNNMDENYDGTNLNDEQTQYSDGFNEGYKDIDRNYENSDQSYQSFDNYYR